MKIPVYFATQEKKKEYGASSSTQNVMSDGVMVNGTFTLSAAGKRVVMDTRAAEFISVQGLGVKMKRNENFRRSIEVPANQ